MTIENNTFPQSGDPDDAVRLAQLIGHDILTNTVRRGLELTADFTAGELTVGSGVSHIGVDSDVAASDSTEIQDLGYIVQTATETITLQNTGFYHVVIEPVLNTNDSPEIKLYSDLANSSEYAFEIGTVDVDAEVVEELNRDIGADIDHDNLIGGTTGNPHSDSASVTDVDSEISSHKSDDVHDQPQPNQSHGNEDHSETYTTAGDNVEDFSTSGSAGTVPVSQGNGTLSMENVSQAIDFIDVETAYDLPDPGTVSKPTIAYVDSQDDYVGVFKQ